MAYGSYVYSLACNKMASNGILYFRVYQETLRSRFLFAKIEIAGAIPQKISWFVVLVSYIASGVRALAWLKKQWKLQSIIAKKRKGSKKPMSKSVRCNGGNSFLTFLQSSEPKYALLVGFKPVQGKRLAPTLLSRDITKFSPFVAQLAHAHCSQSHYARPVLASQPGRRGLVARLAQFKCKLLCTMMLNAA